jgi:hypothetical protein
VSEGVSYESIWRWQHRFLAFRMQVDQCLAMRRDFSGHRT